MGIVRTVSGVDYLAVVIIQVWTMLGLGRAEAFVLISDFW
jgi:hypothetical protein